MKKNMTRYPATKQKGAVLIVALIMLLLLTIIGLSSMRGTALQESMAGNMRDSNLALQASEAALRAGERAAPTLFTVDDLINLQYSGTYSDFPDVASPPTYTVTLLDKYKSETSPGSPFTALLILIESHGFGSSSPGADIKLRSTLFIPY